MAPQRYERISNTDQDDTTPSPHQPIPNSPPPSFRSRTSSPSSHRLLTSSDDPIATEDERALAEAFDDGTPSDDEDNDGDDRQRLMRGNPTSSTPSNTGNGEANQETQRPDMRPRTVTQLPPPTAGTPYRPFQSSNDGVFANLNAKPERGGEKEELPPTYEQAAADATPPYWGDNTVLTPGSLSTDEVFYEGLAVGSLFSFVWNALISLSFQLVGFLLTYLLHTTHAAKHGSRAGLGITLVQWGFGMRASARRGRNSDGVVGGQPATPDFDQSLPPQDPNSHTFDPNAISTAAAIAAQQAQQAAQAQGSSSSLAATAGGSSHDWLAYALMIVGWFILIRAVTDFYKARRHEKLVLASPERGLNVPIVAEGEGAESVA